MSRQAIEAFPTSTYNTPNSSDAATPGLGEAETKSSSQPLIITGERRRIGCHLLLPTLLLTLVSAGLATILLLWLSVIRGVREETETDRSSFAITSGAFYVNEGNSTGTDGLVRARLLGLTLSTVTTQLVGLSAPFMVALTAYCTAGAWLQEQAYVVADGKQDLPTPLQYGLLVKLSSTAGPKALYDAGRYIMFRGKKRQVEPAPYYLTAAFVAVASIYVITHLVNLADIWLHVSSSAVLYNTTTTILSADPARAASNISSTGVSDTSGGGSITLAREHHLGIAFNESLCALRTSAVCLNNDEAWADQFTGVNDIGMHVANNSTQSLAGILDQFGMTHEHARQVITLEKAGDLAVLVPANVAPGTEYIGPSFGARAVCTNITPDCIVPDRNTGSNVDIDTYNCTAAGAPFLPINRSEVLLTYEADKIIPGRITAMVNGTLLGLDYGAWMANGLSENPQTYHVEFTWPLGMSVPRLGEANTFVDYERRGFMYAFAACSIEFFNVTIGLSEGNYRLVDATSCNRQFSMSMAGSLLYQMVTEQLHSHLKAHVYSEKNVDNVMAAVNQELGRLSLAMFASVTMDTPPHTLSLTDTHFVGRYPVAPVIVYVSFLFLYSFIVLGIFTWASTQKTFVVSTRDGTVSATSLELAQARLTDPLTVVAAAFPPKQPPGIIVEDSLELFSEGVEEAPRLALGLNERGDQYVVYATQQQQP